MPQLTANDELEHHAESIGNLLLTSDLPRTYSEGIGRFAIDATRVMENLNLDTTAPLMQPRAEPLMQQLSNLTPERLTHTPVTHPQPRAATTNTPYASPLTHRHMTNHPVPTNVPLTNTRHHMQMTPTTRFEALVYILMIMEVPEDRAKLWAMNALCDNQLPTSTEGARLAEQALQRLPILFPHLAEGNNQQAAGANEGTATTVSRQPGNTAVLGKEGARFTISYPPPDLILKNQTGSCGNHK
jgi:hypothetical protein